MSCRHVIKLQKSIFSPQYATKSQRRILGTALFIALEATYKRVGGQRHVPAVLAPRKSPSTQCTGRWVGSRIGLDGRGGEMSLPPPGFEPLTVQLLASRHTEYTILNPRTKLCNLLLSYNIRRQNTLHVLDQIKGQESSTITQRRLLYKSPAPNKQFMVSYNLATGLESRMRVSAPPSRVWMRKRTRRAEKRRCMRT